MAFLRKIVALLMTILSFLFPGLQSGETGTAGTYKVENGTVYVYVTENGSTGYTWEYSIDGKGLKYDNKTWKCDVDDPYIIGASGTSTYSFVADGEGEFTLTMQYLRSWEDILPEKTLTIEGNTDADGVITITSVDGVEPAE